MKFKDFNFKLAVIQELMYNQGLLEPKFEIYEFARNYTGRKIDIDHEGYAIIPEAKAYFEKIELSEEQLSKVTSLYQDGGNDVYMNLYPFWDGEDNIFNIKSTEDIKLLPNLTSVVLFYDEDASILDDFESRNIAAEWL